MEMSWGVDWSEAVAVAAVAAAVYLTVFALVRVAGRRTVSQMSAFDFLVTVAIGSLIATTILTPDVTYARGVVGIGTLLVCQQAVALIRQRFPQSRRVLDFPPETIYEGTDMKLRTSPLTAQVSEAEIRSKLRQQGIRTLEGVRLVVLESDGTLSVLEASPEQALSDLWRSEDLEGR